MFDAVYCKLLTLLGPFASFSGTLAKNDVYIIKGGQNKAD